MSDSSYSFKYYRYDPSIAAAVIFVLLFASATGLHTYQMVRTRTWYFVPFVIGGFCKSPKENMTGHVRLA